MSLRVRVVLGLALLVAAMTVGADLVTYSQLQSFLGDRLDRQVTDTVGAASREYGGGGVQAGVGTPPPGGGRPPQGANGPPPGGGPPPQGGGAEPQQPPAGAWVELRAADGVRVIKAMRLANGTGPPAPPKLPARVQVSSNDHPVFFDASARTGDGGYRVIAVHDPSLGDQVLVVAVPMTEVDRTLSRLRRIELLVALCGLLVVVVAGAWLVRLSLRPLDRMAGTATAIAGGDLGQRVEPATTRTEVGRLGLALNAMLAQIERAFGVREASEERMRRFLADASHELRTPLTTIRGYAEAFRLGATDDPEELARAMRRIESESARMGVLVEDLLQLARLDAVRETAGVAVDLTSAARDAVDDAAAVAPDRDIRLRSDATVTVVADPDQLHQVASNLLRNAIAHTPPGTSIDVSVERRDGLGVLVVRDHGPGLPPGAAEHVFDRFWQGDPSRTRAGAGLGLAIVDAIVRAHGGRATAGNAAGGGARFVVTFPEAGSA